MIAVKSTSSLLLALFLLACSGGNCSDYCDAQCGDKACENDCEDAMSFASDECEKHLDTYLQCVDEEGSFCDDTGLLDDPCVEEKKKADGACSLEDMVWYRF